MAGNLDGYSEEELRILQRWNALCDDIDISCELCDGQSDVVRTVLPIAEKCGTCFHVGDVLYRCTRCNFMTCEACVKGLEKEQKHLKKKNRRAQGKRVDEDYRPPGGGPTTGAYAPPPAPTNTTAAKSVAKSTSTSVRGRGRSGGTETKTDDKKKGTKSTKSNKSKRRTSDTSSSADSGGSVVSNSSSNSGSTNSNGVKQEKARRHAASKNASAMMYVEPPPIRTQIPFPNVSGGIIVPPRVAPSRRPPQHPSSHTQPQTHTQIKIQPSRQRPQPPPQRQPPPPQPQSQQQQSAPASLSETLARLRSGMANGAPLQQQNNSAHNGGNSASNSASLKRPLMMSMSTDSPPRHSTTMTQSIPTPQYRPLRRRVDASSSASVNAQTSRSTMNTITPLQLMHLASTSSSSTHPLQDFSSLRAHFGRSDDMRSICGGESVMSASQSQSNVMNAVISDLTKTQSSIQEMIDDLMATNDDNARMFVFAQSTAKNLRNNAETLKTQIKDTIQTNVFHSPE